MEYLSLLQTLPGIGDSSLDVLEKVLPFGGVADFFSLVQTVDIPKAVRNIIDDVREKLQEFRKQVAEMGLRQSVLETMRYLRVNSNSVEAKRFLDLAGSFGADLDVFAKHLHSNVGGTVYDDKAEAVSLMSLHAAKGLEFPTVFITGLEDGILPCDLTGEGDTASGFTTMLAEERRLFYVGMTRAQDSLILSYAATRSIYGHYSNRPPSRFLKDIPKDLVTEIEQDKPRRKKSHSKQMKLF